MVVVGRLAGDVGVLAGWQVQALDEAELEQHVECPEDGRPADAEVRAGARVDQVGRREVAVLVGDERRHRAPRLGHAVARCARARRGGGRRRPCPDDTDCGQHLSRLSLSKRRPAPATVGGRRRQADPTKRARARGRAAPAAVIIGSSAASPNQTSRTPTFQPRTGRWPHDRGDRRRTARAAGSPGPRAGTRWVHEPTRTWRTQPITSGTPAERHGPGRRVRAEPQDPTGHHGHARRGTSTAPRAGSRSRTGASPGSVVHGSVRGPDREGMDGDRGARRRAR